jgi:hypothetical protein
LRRYGCIDFADTRFTDDYKLAQEKSFPENHTSFRGLLYLFHMLDQQLNFLIHRSDERNFRVLHQPLTFLDELAPTK